jgi:RNA polymerase sigma-70 factor (ECF subfamily)
MPDQFDTLVEKCIPDLRGYANALCRNVDAAEDLVQDTLVRSLSARAQFVEGTNFKGWVSTILRNRFIDQRRRSRESSEPIENVLDRCFVALPSQEMAVEFDELARAFWRLSPIHQDILMLVGANGLNYREAAETLGCAVGTVRSRLSRARIELRSAMASKPKPGSRLPARRTKGALEFLENLSRIACRGGWRSAAEQGSLAQALGP